MLQALPLELKIRLTQDRIKQWVQEYGPDGVYVSFSGGKDSTVLLYLVRELYPDTPAVFCDTGLEYPEIRDFVKCFDNVVWLKPEKTFKQVISEYGYPFISKEVTEVVYSVKKSKSGQYSYRVARINGELKDKQGNPSRYNCSKWKFLLDAPFDVSNKCCDVMKKRPTKKYEKQTGRHPFIGQLAQESRLREQMWVKNGCNAFESKHPTSNPLSFWTNQDILKYIKQFGIEICSIYGDVVIYDDDGYEYDGLLTDNATYSTTGLDRTGCMFCGFGCHLEKPGCGRFLKMKASHPKQYDYIMRPYEDGGLNYKAVIEWLNTNGNLHIEI